MACGHRSTWFAPVNASEGADAECEEPSDTYLTGFHSQESPFLTARPEAQPSFLSCTNISSWNEGECRPGGKSLSTAQVADAAGCCAKCSSEEGCAAWVYRSDVKKGQLNCWLKSSNSKTTKDKVCTSAGTGTVHPPPPPPAGPPPPPQLYDVVADPGGAYAPAAAAFLSKRRLTTVFAGLQSTRMLLPPTRTWSHGCSGGLTFTSTSGAARRARARATTVFRPPHRLRAAHHARKRTTRMSGQWWHLGARSQR